MKRIYFFATPVDVAPVLERFEAAAPLRFVVSANLTTLSHTTYLAASEIR
jgi:hypothetical protein